MSIRRFFRNGVHPPELKDLTAGVPTRRIRFPERLVMPLQQHIGAPAKAIVRPGDRVERGDKIAEADGFVSVPMHASATGTVRSIDRSPHPDGSWKEAIVIDVDRWSPQAPRPRMVPEWGNLSRKELIAAIQEGGLVGLGGAAFPTHVKLSPPPDEKVDVVVLNGCECEPYLTTDHRTMVEHADRVHLGTRIMMKCLGVDRAVVGIERNKPDAIEAMRATVPSDLNIEIVALDVKYPQGAEKMLIKSLLDLEVPENGLPMNIGVVVQNVASVATIAEIFETGLPLIGRILTVTGRGPMMGIAQGNLDTPVLKGTSGVVVLNQEEVSPSDTHPCIRCGRCLEACPVFLDPQHLGSLGLNGRYEEMTEHHLSTCMLCGCCSYACPSHIPLSHMFGVAKAALRSKEASK